MAYSITQQQEIDRQLFAAIVGRGVTPFLAKIGVAQARLESGNYSSKRFETNKNAFGYTYNANSRWQAGKGGKMPDANGYYANYATFTDSGSEIGDYLIRKADKFKGVATPEQYARVAKSLNYFTAPLADYIKLITNRFKALAHLDTATPQSTAAKKNSNPQSLVFS